MTIYGVTDPKELGITTATRAITTGCIALSEQPGVVVAQAMALLRQRPEVLIFGGWSPEHEALAQEIQGERQFPIICVHHRGFFHGPNEKRELYIGQTEAALRDGLIDHIAFTNPQMAIYFREFRKVPALWVPHALKPAAKIPSPPRERLRLGVLSGEQGWYFNSFGAATVAADMAARFPGTEIAVPRTTENLSYEEYLGILESCHILLRPAFVEGYPTFLQEAWGRGIPAIFSSAADGLAKGPFFSNEEQMDLCRLRLDNTIDPLELQYKIAEARRNWEEYSSSVYRLSKALYARTQVYLKGLFEKVVEGYRRKAYDNEYFGRFYGARANLWAESGVDVDAEA